MKLDERGVLPQSDIYIYNSSLIRKEYFYQLLCTGHYRCTHGYAVRPNTLDSYLLIYVSHGRLHTSLRSGERSIVKAGQLAILNCYERPSYCCADEVDFLWMHFDSHGIDQLFEAMEHHIVDVKDRSLVRSLFEQVLSRFASGGQPSEARLNKVITDLLTQFFEDGGSDNVPANRFEKVMDYINNNLERKMSNAELAAMVNMSEFHFIRSFRKETGFTPHEFIQRSRVNTARFLLQATNLSLSQITYRCGYANEPAFSNSFKALTGTTPLKCRQEAFGRVSARERIASVDLIARDDE